MLVVSFRSFAGPRVCSTKLSIIGKRINFLIESNMETVI